jgi:hypothetical protein
VWAIVVVVRCPLLEFLVQVYIVLVRQELVELLLAGSVRSFHLTIEFRGAWFDVNMPDTPVLDMPMEKGLKLMTSIRTDGVDAKRELFDNVVDELNSVVLIATGVDLQGSDPGGAIDRCVLKATNSMPSRSLEAHNLHVCLDMMTGDLSRIFSTVSGESTRG